MEYLIKGETLESIADAIRAKTGKTNKILPADFSSEIAGISGDTITVTGSVNGKEVKQIVAAGKTINKGDFVELVGGGTSFSLAEFDISLTSGGKQMYMLDENTMVLFNAKIIFVFEFTDNSWNLLYKTTLSMNGDSGYTGYCRLTDNIFIVGAGDYLSYNGSGLYTYFNISVIEITKTGVYEKLSNNQAIKGKGGSSTSPVGTMGTLHALDSTHILVSVRFVYGSETTNNIYILGFSEDYSTLTTLSKGITGSDISYALVLNENEIVRRLENVVELWGINNYVLSKKHEYNLGDNVSASGGISFFNGQVFVYDGSYVIGLKVENDELIASGVTTSLYRFPSYPLSNELFIKIYNYILYLYNNNFEVLSTVELNSSGTCLVVSSTEIYVLNTSDKTVTNYRITDDNKIVVNEEVGSKVQPAKSALYLYGVALESGTGGQEIRIAIPSAAVETDQEETITDLTNTSWIIPSGWTATSGYGKFNVEHIVGETTHFNSLGIGYGFDDNALVPIESANVVSTYYSDFVTNTYTPTDSFALTITGGSDVTNTDLISWLQTYGTLQNSGPTPV